jgi:AcrR family transcriptional regulator
MKVSAETRAATRERILETARKLFAERGFEATTTRDIARAAEIAAGTLFNYFATKEAIAATLAAEALSRAELDFETAESGAGTLEEDLFVHITAGLRKLKPFRKALTALLETSLSPLVAATSSPEGESLRVRHLEAVGRIAARHSSSESLTAVAAQLYWNLYTGVLAFWAADKSPRQEDTYALLDQSMAMFAGWWKGEGAKEKKKGLWVAEPGRG